MKKTSREAYGMLTKDGGTAFQWMQAHDAELVITFAPQTLQQWTAVADGLRMWKNCLGPPRRVGLISLHTPGLLTDEVEATLDLVKGGAAWNNTMDDLMAERVVYLQLVGAITEMQGMPRNGTNIAIMHILDTTKVKGQKCQNTPGFWPPSVDIQIKKTRHHGVPAAG